MKRISAVEARRRFGTMLDEVKHQGTEYVIERDSRPAAVVISLEAFQRYQKARRQAFDAVEALRERFADEISTSELEAWIDEASADVRSGRH